MTDIERETLLDDTEDDPTPQCCIEHPEPTGCCAAATLLQEQVDELTAKLETVEFLADRGLALGKAVRELLLADRGLREGQSFELHQVRAALEAMGMKL